MMIPHLLRLQKPPDITGITGVIVAVGEDVTLTPLLTAQIGHLGTIQELAAHLPTPRMK